MSRVLQDRGLILQRCTKLQPFNQLIQATEVSTVSYLKNEIHSILLKYADQVQNSTYDSTFRSRRLHGTMFPWVLFIINIPLVQ